MFLFVEEEEKAGISLRLFISQAFENPLKVAVPLVWTIKQTITVLFQSKELSVLYSWKSFCREFCQ